jgi:hypothetical protein
LFALISCHRQDDEWLFLDLFIAITALDTVGKALNNMTDVSVIFQKNQILQIELLLTANEVTV